jgi:hypothetical protein
MQKRETFIRSPRLNLKLILLINYRKLADAMMVHRVMVVMKLENAVHQNATILHLFAANCKLEIIIWIFFRSSIKQEE